MGQYDIDIRFTSQNVSPFLMYNHSLLLFKQGDFVDRKDDQSNEKINHSHMKIAR